jgi:hypothetical protein
VAPDFLLRDQVLNTDRDTYNSRCLALSTPPLSVHDAVKNSSLTSAFVSSSSSILPLMDSTYLLQLNCREHLPDHPDYRHPYPSAFSSDDPQFWPYAYPDQPSHYPPYQCDPQPVSAVPGPIVYENPSQGMPSRLGIFDISAMHAPVGSAEPWGPRNDGERVFVLICSSYSLNPPQKWISRQHCPVRVVSLRQTHIIPFLCLPPLGFIRPRAQIPRPRPPPPHHHLSTMPPYRHLRPENPSRSTPSP